MVANNVLIRDYYFKIVTWFWVSLLPSRARSHSCMLCYNSHGPSSKTSKSGLVFCRRTNCAWVASIDLAALQNTPMPREEWWFLHIGNAGISCQGITPACKSAAPAEAGTITTALDPWTTKGKENIKYTVHILLLIQLFAYKVYFYV